MQIDDGRVYYKIIYALVFSLCFRKITRYVLCFSIGVPIAVRTRSPLQICHAIHLFSSPMANIQKSVELNGRASCNVWPKDGVSMLGRDYRNFVVTIMA